MNEVRGDADLRSLWPVPDGRDRLPVWVIVLLVVFLALRLLDLHGDWVASRSSHVSSLAGQTDEQTMSETINTNWMAKTAYINALTRPGQSSLDPDTLKAALTSAEALQKSAGNSPTTARRVIVLRALLKRTLFGPGKNGLDPGAAFLPAALSDLPPAEAARAAAEGRLWQDVARGPHLTPAQTYAEAVQIRTIPNIRWWQYPALSLLYQSQGNSREAQRQAGKAETQALLTMGPLLAMLLVWGVLGLGGLILLILLLTRRFERGPMQSIPEIARSPDPWPTLREIVPLTERRLRAGDLMGVFVLYLLMPDLIGWLLGGFGVHKLFYFHGLLAPYRAHLKEMPAGSRVAAVIVLEFFAYLLGAAVPIAVLIGIARHKRASIAEELGWNVHRFGANLLYGVGGYAVALPLVFLAGLAGPQLFRHAPAPSNPALPLLANAPTLWVQLLLAALATIAAPLTEELLFRGVFYNAAKLRVGVWPAIILTGLIFGFVHPVGIAEMLPLAVLGGVFAWMAETRKSLVPSMLGHFLQNSMATLMLLLVLAG